jgi:thiol-disulfide isomerase/thioredoxin
MDAMISRPLICTFLLSVAFSVSAATLKIPSLKVGPVTYSNVNVIGANATDLYFTHDQGIGNVKLKYVGADLQKRFNYDPRAAAEAEKKQAEADALYQSVVISNMTAEASALAAKDKAAPAPVNLADPISDRSLLGKAAPALQVENWVGEQPSFEGKYVLLSFWAPWSAASRQCIPELNALQKKFASKLVVIGISPPSENGDETNSPKLEFTSAIDAKAKTSAAAGIHSIPAVLLIDPGGIVRYEGHPAAITEKKLQALFSPAGQ